MVVLKSARLVSYALTWALGVVAGAASLNSLIKALNDRNKDTKIAEQLAPFPNFTVKISLNDIILAGGVLAAGELLLAIIAWHSLICLLPIPFVSREKRYFLRRRTERSGVHLLALASWVFALIWTFAAAIATLDYGVNRSAKTKAYVAGQELPAATVKALEAATGLSPKYWIHGYTKFLCIASWPLLVFATISTVLTFIAWRRTSSAGYVDEDNENDLHHAHHTRTTAGAGVGDGERDSSDRSVHIEKGKA